MNLKELKKMIAEEYDAYKKEKIKEQPLPAGPMGPMGDIDATEKDDSPTDILKDIFDMLKDHFEGDDKKDDKKDDDKGDDVEDKEDEEADLEETTINGGGAYTTSLNEKKKNKNSKLLAEVKMKSRFKKLANIKK